MTTLELKGGMLEMITRVQDKTALEELYRMIAEFVSQRLNKSDYSEDLSPEQFAELEVAIAESYDESNWISHEEMMKKYERWLKP